MTAGLSYGLATGKLLKKNRRSRSEIWQVAILRPNETGWCMCTLMEQLLPSQATLVYLPFPCDNKIWHHYGQPFIFQTMEYLYE